MIQEKNNDLLQSIITQALQEMKEEQGGELDLERVNLAELERRTGISRAKLRRIKKNGFIVPVNGHRGIRSDHRKISDYTDTIDCLLRKGVKNSSVCFSRIREMGYTGGITQVKEYIHDHKDLLPKKRKAATRKNNRGRRYQTKPGEKYQMDWGFVNVESRAEKVTRLACFVMVCHACGKRYVEFFPNAKQENLFIGMIHAFQKMGVPKIVLTDNMKSVVTKRNADHKPVWNRDYELFMNNIGFETELCQPYHPYTKGAVERSVRFVKDNFLQGREFTELTELNYQALRWTGEQNGTYRQSVDCVPDKKHATECMLTAAPLVGGPELYMYLAPLRRISFDGFVNYEGRRFGVPYSYAGMTCRVYRDGYTLYILDPDTLEEITSHDVTWSRKDSYCADQFLSEQPEEQPTMPVHSTVKQNEKSDHDPWFDQFRLEGGDWNE